MTENTEKRSHVRHPEIKGTEVSPRVNTRNRFETKQTHLEGVVLRVEPGSEVSLPQSTTEGFLEDAVNFRKADIEVKNGTKDRVKYKNRILETVEANEGLRGIISEKDDTKLTVTPTEETVVYDAQKLRESMSKRNYRQVVAKETVIVEFILPKSVEPEIAEEIIREGLREIGVTVSKRAKIAIKPQVNETLLSQKINNNEVKLLPGARRSRRGLSVKAEPAVANRKVTKQ